MTDEDLHERIAAIARRLPASIVRAATERLESSSSLNGLPTSPGLHELISLERDWVRVGRTRDQLSSALFAASLQDEWWRDHQGMSLVWTGPAMSRGTLRKTEQALLEVIEAADEQLWLVSFAGYGVRNIRNALRAAALRGVHLNIIIESPEISKGKVTFSVLEGIDERLAEIATVFVWPLEKRATTPDGKHGTLHVKCALADETKLFVSSANLTDHAMTLNMELGMLVDGGREPARLAAHFRWLLEEGYLVPLANVSA